MTEESFPLNRKEIESLAKIALWGALIAAGAWVAIPLGPVPITLQTFFIVLAGFYLGLRAFYAATLYVLAGLIGLPVFTGAVAGPALLLGPTAGFALAFPIAALVAGLSKGRKECSPSPWRFLLCGTLAILIIYLGGLIGLRINLHISWQAAFWIILTFVPGDALKILAATMVARSLATNKETRTKVKNDLAS
jgi:biotin transport system substrate-specific component